MTGGAACAADANAVCYKTDARGITSTYTYDGLNRVTGVSYNDGVTPAVTYAYGTSSASNNNGRLVSVTVGSGSPVESYTYDQLGRITEAKETVDGVDYRVDYTYNPDNSLHTIQYPSQRVVTQNYDGRVAHPKPPGAPSFAFVAKGGSRQHESRRTRGFTTPSSEGKDAASQESPRFYSD